MNLPKIQLTAWHRRVGYALFALAAFVVALRQTFPREAVKERLVLEAAAQGWQLAVADVQPAGLVGVGLRGVTLESRDGLRIPVERLDAALRLWPLLLGRRGVAFDATLFEGRVKGYAEASSKGKRIVATVAGLDLGRAVALRKATGVDLAGTVRGDVDLTFDEKNPTRSAGGVDLAVDRAAVNGGDLPVPGMAGTLTVPKMSLGQVTAHGAVKDGKLTFDKLGAHSDDLDASAEGMYLVLQPRIAYAPIFGKGRLKIDDRFWTKGNAAGFKGIVELALAPARAQDGAYGFQVFGTISKPEARMAP